MPDDDGASPLHAEFSLTAVGCPECGRRVPVDPAALPDGGNLGEGIEEARKLTGEGCPDHADPVPVLGPDEARALLRECAAVVAPGETLVVRVPCDWTEEQRRRCQQEAAALAGGAFPVVVVACEELAVARPAPASPADEVTVTTLEHGVRLVHVPSGTAVEAETREQAAGALALALAKAGVIAARDAREEPVGVPPAVAEASLRARVAGMVTEMMPGMLSREMQRQASQAKADWRTTPG